MCVEHASDLPTAAGLHDRPLAHGHDVLHLPPAALRPVDGDCVLEPGDSVVAGNLVHPHEMGKKIRSKNLELPLES
ncbi:unnamed protein product [Urochloa humidicola]